MNSTLRYGLIVVAVAIMAAFAGYQFSGRQALPPPASPLATAAPARDAATRLLALKLQDSEGHEQALAAWRGKVLVVNFWATWCPPCRDEIPEFAEISRKLSANGVQFVGISMEDADKVREFSREVSVPYPLLLSGPDNIQLLSDLGNHVQALPFTVVLRRDGQIHHARLGRQSGAELEKTVLAALAQG